MGRELIKLGVSACLLGQEVRYDGKHKRQHFIADTLSRYFDFVPLCPEVEIGMGVPRPPIQLVGDANNPRACGVDNNDFEVTAPLQDYAEKMAQAHGYFGGYIFKCRSPSCGVRDAPIVDDRFQRVAAGSGIYAARIKKLLPLLPVIDEERLLEPEYFESFIRQISAYSRWQKLQETAISIEALRGFHEDHRLLCQAHGPETMESLDDLVRHAEHGGLSVVADQYIRLLLEVLAHPASLASHVDVLLNIFTQVKSLMEPEARNELSIAIADFKGNESPWQNPVAKIISTIESGSESELARQVYLYPHGALNLLQQGSI